MIASGWLWAVFTIIAAAGQTARNAMQRELTATLGTAGATQVRFLFGFPFAVLFLIGVLAVTGLPLPKPPLEYWPWVALGAGCQVLATALMLAAMGERSFVVAIAYIKTEPVQVAIFALVFLGEHVTPLMMLAIGVATVGVVLTALKPGVHADARPTYLGLAAGAMFALSAVGFRASIVGLNSSSFILDATFTLVIGLFLQAAVLSAYLLAMKPDVMRAIFRAWRPSVFAGFMGAFASQFWFLAFALATAASVRTLALVEVLFAQAVGFFLFNQRSTRREALGTILIVAGVALLLLSQR